MKIEGKTAEPNMRKLIAYAVGTFSVLFGLLIYSTRNGSEHVHRVLSPEVAGIVEIDIIPTIRHQREKSYIVRDPTKIAEFCNLVRRAKQTYPNHHSYTWEAVITYKYQNRLEQVLVAQEKRGEYYLLLYSSITDGFFYGAFELGGFGKWKSNLS